MDILKSFTGNPVEKGKVFHHRDDGAFQFIERHIEDNALIEKGNNDMWVKAWALFFKLEKDFAGYKNLKPGRVTVTYGRDIIFDPFGELGEEEKPEKGRQLIKKFIAAEAEAKCYKHEKAPTESLVFNKAVWFIGSVMVILGLALGYSAVY